MENSSCYLEKTRTAETTAGSAKFSPLSLGAALGCSCRQSMGWDCHWSCSAVLSVISGPTASQLRRAHKQAESRDASGPGETLAPFFLYWIFGRGRALCQFTAWFVSKVKSNPLQNDETTCLSKGCMGYFCVNATLSEIRQGTSNKRACKAPTNDDNKEVICS